MRVDTQAFNEIGGPAALSGAGRAYESNATTLGVRFESARIGGLPLIARGMLGWRHAFGVITPQETMAFESAPSNPFVIAGAPIARDSLAAETGLDWRLNRRATIGLFYSGELARNANDNAVEGKVEVKF